MVPKPITKELNGSLASVCDCALLGLVDGVAPMGLIERLAAADAVVVGAGGKLHADDGRVLARIAAAFVLEVVGSDLQDAGRVRE
jgi:hypothetical protein